jgi:hypothetical protein
MDCRDFVAHIPAVQGINNAGEIAWACIPWRCGKSA